MSLAPIERLPVELLQPIFFASDYNLSLLQSSDRIAAKLSSHYVYHPTSTHWLAGVVGSRIAQSAAQSYILASKWMTWSFFKSWAIKAYEHNGCLCGLTAESGCFDAQWPPNFENATEMVFSRSHLPRIAFMKGRIPKKLLRGPWTQDKIQFLSFLLWITSMTVDWSDPEARQIAIEGRLQAIRQKNLDAVELFNHNRRLGRAADMSLVRFAVMEAGCDRSIVYDTMAMASLWAPDASWECSALASWCEERIAANDPRGTWLKTKLKELRTPAKPGKGSHGDGADHRRFPGGGLSSETADYDGGADDQLTVKRHRWNQVSALFLFYRSFYPYFRIAETVFSGPRPLDYLELLAQFDRGNTCLSDHSDATPPLYLARMRNRKLENWLASKDWLASKNRHDWLSDPSMMEYTYLDNVGTSVNYLPEGLRRSSMGANYSFIYDPCDAPKFHQSNIRASIR